ncbi:MAG: DUF111 family protein [Deltaproteobacteria bacterium]|nr:DUF111 family protein [Deltaproteobacteria bacterium]
MAPCPRGSSAKSVTGPDRATNRASPNALRAVLIDAEPAAMETCLVVEANIDDMNPQLFPRLTEKLFEAGAMDVALSPCVMKKGRPGTLVKLLAPEAKLEAVAATLFAESTTIGLRYWPAGRLVGERRIEHVETEFGRVAVKVTRHGGRVVNAQPEYADCERLANEKGIPVKRVWQAAAGLAARFFGV